MTINESILVGLIVLVGGVILWFLLSLPGSIARQRKHENAVAIAICGWLGLIFFPCWFVAIVWANTGQAKPARNPYRPPVGNEWPDELEAGKPKSQFELADEYWNGRSKKIA